MTADIQPAGSPHVEFLAWAAAQGVETSGVRPTRILSRGLGMVAEEPIKAGTEIVRVPLSALLTTDCILDKFVDKHDADLTVHGLLASFITNGSPNQKEMGKFLPWQATWPTYDDFAECMPLLWPAELREPWKPNGDGEGFWLLPPNIGAKFGSWEYSEKPERKVDGESIIGKQHHKLKADLGKVLMVFPDMDQKEYVRNWMVVNTRSFYYDQPLRRKPLSHEDKMILCPVIDYFNHSDTGCTVTFDQSGYYVAADRDYDVGEELFVSYGAHDNDTLLAEYGFVPAENRFDCLSLDAWMLAPSTGIEKGHSARLRKAGYWENYNIVAVEGYGEVCHRTHVAARAATMKPNRWLLYIRGKNPTEGEEEACRFLCDDILLPFKQTVQESLNGLKTMHKDAKERIREQIEHADKDKCVAHINSTLILRWTQIEQMIDQAIDHLDD